MAERGPAGWGLRDLAVRGDERGSLIALEVGGNVPFEVRRAYYVFGTKPGVVRGHHAHRAGRQFAVSVNGGCTMLFDNGRERRALRLDRPDRGLIIEPMVWHEMSDWSPGAVLLVLADTLYDEADYIRDYDEFTRLAETRP